MFYEDEELDIPLTLEEQEENNVNSYGRPVEEDEEIEEEIEDEEIEEDEDLDIDTSIDYTEDPDSANLDLDA